MSTKTPAIHTKNRSLPARTCAKSIELATMEMPPASIGNDRITRSPLQAKLEMAAENFWLRKQRQAGVPSTRSACGLLLQARCPDAPWGQNTTETEETGARYESHI